MIFKKGMRVKGKSNIWWYVRKTQDTNKYLEVESKDGFKTIVDINLMNIYDI